MSNGGEQHFLKFRSSRDEQRRNYKRRYSRSPDPPSNQQRRFSPPALQRHGYGSNDHYGEYDNYHGHDQPPHPRYHNESRRSQTSASYGAPADYPQHPDYSRYPPQQLQHFQGGNREDSNFQSRSRRRERSQEYESDPEKRAKRKRVEQKSATTKEEKPQPAIVEPQSVWDSLRSLIIKLGNKASSEKKFNLLLPVIVDDCSTYGDAIRETIIACATDLPAKTVVYSTLVGIINLKIPEFVGRLIQDAATLLVAKLAAGDWIRVKTLTRFFAILAEINVISVTSLYELLAQMQNMCEKHADHIHVQEQFVNVLMLTLPWIGKKLEENNASLFTNLVSTLEQFIMKRKEAHEKAISWQFVFDNQTMEENDVLEWSWKHVKGCLQQKDWGSSVIWRPFTFFASDFAQNQHIHDIKIVLTDLDEIALKRVHPHRAHLGLASKLKPSYEYSSDEEDEEEEEQLSGFDTMIIEDYICDSLFIFNASAKECAKQLISLPLDCEYQSLILDTLFGFILMTPEAPFKSLFYINVILELCRLKEAFCTMLLHFMDIVFEKLSNMNAEPLDRYTEWFAYHLSSTDLQYVFHNWRQIIEQREKTSKTFIFVQEVINRLLRLYKVEKLRKALPSYFDALLPNMAPMFFGEQDKNFVKAKKVLEAMRSKAPVDDVKQLFQEMDTPTSDMNSSEKEQLHIGIMSTLYASLYIRDKIDVQQGIPYVNLEAILDKYAPVLSELVSKQNKKNENISKLKRQRQMQILDSICTYWSHRWGLHGKQCSLAIQTFWDYSLIDTKSICSWIFCKKNATELSQSGPWELLEQLLKRQLDKTRGANYALESSQRSIEFKKDILDKITKEAEEIVKLMDIEDSKQAEKTGDQAEKTADQVEKTAADSERNDFRYDAKSKSKKQRLKELETHKKRLHEEIEYHPTAVAQLRTQFSVHLVEFKHMLWTVFARIIKFVHQYSSGDELQEQQVFDNASVQQRFRILCMRYRRFLCCFFETSEQVQQKLFGDFQLEKPSVAQLRQSLAQAVYFDDSQTNTLSGIDCILSLKSTTRVDLLVQHQLTTVDQETVEQLLLPAAIQGADTTMLSDEEEEQVEDDSSQQQQPQVIPSIVAE